jgi:hypothetical protein
VAQFFLFCSFSVSRRCHFGYGGKKVSAGELDLPEVEITIPVKCQILYHNLSFAGKSFGKFHGPCAFLRDWLAPYLSMDG